MNREEKRALFLATGGLTIVGLGFLTNSLSMNEVYLGILISASAGAGYYGYKNKWFEKHLSQFQKGEPGYKDDWTDEEALEYVKEWSKRNYGQEDSVEYHWSNAEDATVRVPSGLEDVDMEKLYAVWTDHGPLDQGIQVFVNCTTKEKLNHLRLRFEEQRFRPFLFCDYYHEARRNSRYSREAFEDVNKTIRSVGGRALTGGLPADSLTPVKESSDSGDGDSGGQ